MNTLLFIALAIIATYIAATIALTGSVPCSISNTYYIWRDMFNIRFLFTFVMWIVGMLTVICWIGKCGGKFEFLPFLSVSGMCFVGGASAFKETLTQGVHYTAAGVWAGSALAFFALMHLWLAILIGAFCGLIGFALNRRQNLTFWAEIAVVCVMFSGILML